MKKDKVIIKLYVDTGFAGGTHEDTEEIEKSDWETMSEDERNKYLDDAALAYLSNTIEYGAYVDEEQSEAAE